MTIDELEFLISQHLDGTLDQADASRLQHALATRADARELLASYEKLEHALKATQRPMEVDGEWLTAQIAGRIDEADAEPRSLKIWHYAGPMAMAAALLIALTLGVIFLRDDGEMTSPIAQQPTIVPAPAIAQITLDGPPAPPVIHEAAMATVTVSAPADLSPATVTALYLNESRPTGRVSIRPAGPSEPEMFE